MHTLAQHLEKDLGMWPLRFQANTLGLTYDIKLIDPPAKKQTPTALFSLNSISTSPGRWKLSRPSPLSSHRHVICPVFCLSHSPSRPLHTVLLLTHTPASHLGYETHPCPIPVALNPNWAMKTPHKSPDFCRGRRERDPEEEPHHECSERDSFPF